MFWYLTFWCDCGGVSRSWRPCRWYGSNRSGWDMIAGQVCSHAHPCPSSCFWGGCWRRPVLASLHDFQIQQTVEQIEQDLTDAWTMFIHSNKVQGPQYHFVLDVSIVLDIVFGARDLQGKMEKFELETGLAIVGINGSQSHPPWKRDLEW